MAEIKYSKEQIEELLKNKYVKSCTSKNVNFTKEFKIKVLELDKKWLFYREIFKLLWFPEYIFNSRIPKLSLDRWKVNINKKWVIEEKKWRKKKEYFDVSKMSKDEYIEYLEAKLALTEELKRLENRNYP